ncbi:MAG: hypothetical protein IPF53_23060 [Blastocatellia bacterium]|nr:hypothetical protein [Blastocatellia bacterium]
MTGRILDTPVRTPVDVPYFHHTRRGIWVVAGPDVEARSGLGPLSIVDVCPTAMHMLGIGVPDDLDGRVALELFREGSVPQSRPVKKVTPDATISADDGEAYDDDAIKEKLRGLGYMH